MIKVLELFAGIGACSKALTNLGIEHEIVDAVEIDKYAIASFNAIHGTSFEPQDITKWNKDIQVDLIMHGSPCQDFSVAGKGYGSQQDRAVYEDGLAPTLSRCNCHGDKAQVYLENQRRIRKLTPKECWRLMGFDDADFEKAEKVNSNTQLYKQAGNSIVVNVLEAILSKLLKGDS